MSDQYYKSAEQCPDRAKHTPDPPGHLAWHAWAEKKARTHDQFQCPTCGFWVIWKRRKSLNRDKTGKPSAATGECRSTRHPEEPLCGVQDG